MIRRLAYRQFHDQTSVATAVTVILAEFGLRSLDTTIRGQELVLHGLVQRGKYEADSGLGLRNALKHIVDAGLRVELRHDTSRTAALERMLAIANPGFRLRLPSDLGSRVHRPLDPGADFEDDARVLLVEARSVTRTLALHVLLARREAGYCYVMNPENGADRRYERRPFTDHLVSPVTSGMQSMAGGQYLYVGVAVRIWK